MVAASKTPDRKVIAMRKDQTALHSKSATAQNACHPSLMATSQIIINGANFPQYRDVQSASQTLQHDLLQSFIAWNIETHRTSRHTLFSNWLGGVSASD